MGSAESLPSSRRSPNPRQALRCAWEQAGLTQTGGTGEGRCLGGTLLSAHVGVGKPYDSTYFINSNEQFPCMCCIQYSSWSVYLIKFLK